MIRMMKRQVPTAWDENDEPVCWGWEVVTVVGRSEESIDKAAARLGLEPLRQPRGRRDVHRSILMDLDGQDEFAQQPVR